MPRHECPGGHFAGGTTMPTTAEAIYMRQLDGRVNSAGHAQLDPPCMQVASSVYSSRPRTPTNNTFPTHDSHPLFVHSLCSDGPALGSSCEAIPSSIKLI